MEAEAGRAPLVALMDSGVGGLPYLESARLLLPGARFVYLADRAGFPYGTKTREEVEAIVRNRVDRLAAAFELRALVIACNTASQAALAAARRDHPGLPIVGTVPAVKPAAERTKSGVIGILATERAVRDPYLDELEARFASNCRVERRAAQDLVAFVERRLFAADAAERRAVLLPHLEALVEAGADVIVLACTHFLHVARDIEELASELARARGRPPVGVIDSREGVARRLRELLGPQETGEGSASDPGPGSFHLSGPPPFEEVYGDFARSFGLLGPFPLPGEEGRSPARAAAERAGR